MKKTLIAAALMALLAGPVYAQQSGDQGYPSGANTNKAQGFQGAQPSQRMGHYRSGRHHYRHHRYTRHQMRHHMRHHHRHAM